MEDEMKKNSNLFLGIFLFVTGLLGTCCSIYLGYCFMSIHVLTGIVLMAYGFKYILDNIGTKMEDVKKGGDKAK